MLKVLLSGVFLAVGSGALACPSHVLVDGMSAEAMHQTSIATNRLATNRLATNKLASNRLASNKLASNRLASNRLASNKLASNRLASNSFAQWGMSPDDLSFKSTGPGDITPLLTITAVTLADGTWMELTTER